MSDASLCNVSAGGAKLFRSGAKLTNEVSGALILAMPMGDRRRWICELRKAQRPTKLLVPGFASGTHSYDDRLNDFRFFSPPPQGLKRRVRCTSTASLVVAPWPPFRSNPPYCPLHISQ